MKTSSGWSAERKEEVYNRIDSGDYGTRETSEPNCRKIVDNSTGLLVGYICVKCGRVFSDCSGGYRYQHIRNCQGNQLNRILLKRKSKIKTTSNKPIPIPATKLPNTLPSIQPIINSNTSAAISSLPSSTKTTTATVNGIIHRNVNSFISNTNNNNNNNNITSNKNNYYMNYINHNDLNLNSWLKFISANEGKEKFLKELSKLLIDYLPINDSFKIINQFSNIIKQQEFNQTQQNEEINNISTSPLTNATMNLSLLFNNTTNNDTLSSSVNGHTPNYNSYNNNNNDNENNTIETPITVNDSNSPTPMIAQIKSEVTENGHLSDLDSVIQNFVS